MLPTLDLAHVVDHVELAWQNAAIPTGAFAFVVPIVDLAIFQTAPVGVGMGMTVSCRHHRRRHHRLVVTVKIAVVVEHALAQQGG